MRSSNEKKLGGVCAGIADYIDTDPTVIRVLWIVLTFFTAVFPGILLYIILWVVMPAGKTPQSDELD